MLNILKSIKFRSSPFSAPMKKGTPLFVENCTCIVWVTFHERLRIICHLNHRGGLSVDGGSGSLERDLQYISVQSWENSGRCPYSIQWLTLQWQAEKCIWQIAGRRRILQLLLLDPSSLPRGYLKNVLNFFPISLLDESLSHPHCFPIGILEPKFGDWKYPQNRY